jgi:hypothetical protein
MRGVFFMRAFLNHLNPKQRTTIGSCVNVLLIVVLISWHAVLHAQTITSGPLSGPIHGTTVPNTTYIITDSIVVNPGDSLHVSAGDTIIMASPFGAMFVYGHFYFEGTSSNPIVITVPDSLRHLGPGQWGGIVADSCGIFSMKFTKIYCAGGVDFTGHAYRTVDVTSDYQNLQQIIFSDNLIDGTVDDAIGIHGGNFSILRNVCKYCGAPDGDNINIKSGACGEIAYNIVWAAGGSAIKINSSSKTRFTNVCVHNNTCIASGWRRTGEPGYGILVDAGARAEIYNNIFGDNLGDMDITALTDTMNIHYNNNFFFSSVDSMNQMSVFYTNDGLGDDITRPQANDKYMTGHVTGSPFARYNPWFGTDFTTMDSNNDYHLIAQYTGLGYTPPLTWTNPAFTGQLPGASNVGALGETITAVDKAHTNNPIEFALKQNYPNPFNPTTTIQYILPHEGQVTLKVYNLLGQLVQTLVNSVETAGAHTVQFDGSKLSSGMYLYRLQSGPLSIVSRMLMLK